MSRIRHIVLDVLKPHEPPVTDICSSIGDLEGVDGVNVTVMQVDKDVEGVKVTIKGENIDVGQVEKVIEDSGCAIHSIDKVSCGEEIVKDAPTPQD
ncbi:MAG: DUF211 domain-containing protein [Candidatus Nanoarchaeia archaeon]